MRYIKERIKRIHGKSVDLAGTKWGEWMLFAFAFSDASFFPLPVTTIFLTILVLRNSGVSRLVAMVSLGTLAGALAGYVTGHFAWVSPDGEITRLGHFLLNNIPGLSEGSYNKMHLLYSRYGIGLLFISTLIPVPYGIFSISSGVFGINLLIFSLTTLISQAIKFTIIAIFTMKAGARLSGLRLPRLKPLRLRLLTVRV